MIAQVEAKIHRQKNGKKLKTSHLRARTRKVMIVAY